MKLVCLRCSLELHQTLVLSGSSAMVDAQLALPSQLALPAPPPPTTSADPPASQAVPPAVSPGSVQHQPPPSAVAFTGVPIHSHSLPPPAPAPAPGTTPYQHHIQLGGQVVQPATATAPVLSVLAYDPSASLHGTAVFDPRSGLATKIKGGLALAGLAKTSNKFSPY